MMKEKQHPQLECQIKFLVTQKQGDGAYDPNAVRAKIYEKGARAIIPPPRHASIKEAIDGWMKDRDEDIAKIYSYGDREIGRKPWKVHTGYHKRSLVETAMFRIKKKYLVSN